MSDRPYAGESIADYRARRKSEMEGAPTPEAGFEAQKAKVAAQHNGARRPAQDTGKHAVDIDAAADDEEGVKATHKRLAGGVQPVDKAAADKAYKADADFAKKKPEEQQARARKGGAAYTTETPGSSHQTSMAAAMATAGVQLTPAAPAENKEAPKRTPSPAPSAAVSAHNNMGAPRVQDNGHSAVAGLTIDPAEAAAARRSAGMGTRKNGGVAEKAPTPAPAGPSTPRAIQESPQLPKAPGGRFSSKPRAEMFAHVVGLEHGESSPMSSRPAPAASPAPASNPAPHSPAPTSNATPAAPVAPTTTPSSDGRGLAFAKSLPKGNVGHVSGFSPEYDRKDGSLGGAQLGRHFASRTGKAAEAQSNRLKTDGPDKYWADRDAKTAAGKTPKASSPAPKAVVSEPPSIAAKPDAPAPSNPVASSPAPSAAPASVPAVPSRPSAPAPSPEPLQRAYAPHYPAPESSAGRANRAPAVPPTINTAQAAAATGAPPKAPTGKVTGRVDLSDQTAVAPAGPRPGTISAARGGGVSGGEHSINVGGDNHGQITSNHNTYNVNYGVLHGSQGNVDHGYAPRGGTGAGGRSAGPGHGAAPHEEAVKGDAWVKDRSGTHSLRGTADRLAGRTGGSGEKLHKGKKSSGTQKPLAGSARASGASTPAPQGTGTTNNWQGPQAGVTHPASGIGTANHGKTAP